MDWSLITRMSNKRKRKRRKKSSDEIVQKGFKRATGFTGGLLVNIIIVYIVVKAFSYSFNFAYSIFGNVCKDPAATAYSTVVIKENSSVMSIGEAIEKAGIIDDKLAFYVKVVLRDCEKEIVPDAYQLSASMDYDEILDVICCVEAPEGEGDAASSTDSR